MNQNLRRMPHIQVLDGWRGISIVLVLLGHLFPLGPKSWQLNETFATMGMALFFCLSGFLITNTLLHRPSVREFLIRRLCRIVPLAWAFMLVVLVAGHAHVATLLAQLFFVANVPPFFLTDMTGHLWSLCVEVQFYLTVALLFALFRRRGLLLLPLLSLGITGLRIATHTHVSIVTWLRVDEILAGATMALALDTGRFARIKHALKQRGMLFVLLALALASASPWFGPLAYLRPYLATLMIGQTILFAPGMTGRVLRSKPLAFLAEISYALYVLHPLVHVGWLDTGSKLMRYAKRMPALAAVFAAAWASSHFYERWWIEQGKRWSRKTLPAPIPLKKPQVADVA